MRAARWLAGPRLPSAAARQAPRSPPQPPPTCIAALSSACVAAACAPSFCANARSLSRLLLVCREGGGGTERSTCSRCCWPGDAAESPARVPGRQRRQPRTRCPQLPALQRRHPQQASLTSSSTRCSSRASASAANLAARSASSASEVAAASCATASRQKGACVGQPASGQVQPGRPPAPWLWQRCVGTGPWHAADARSPSARQGQAARLAGSRTTAGQAPQLFGRQGTQGASAGTPPHLAHRLRQALLRRQALLHQPLLAGHRLLGRPLQLDLGHRVGAHRVGACWFGVAQLGGRRPGRATSGPAWTAPSSVWPSLRPPCQRAAQPAWPLHGPCMRCPPAPASSPPGARPRRRPTWPPAGSCRSAPARAPPPP